ncbi:MAG: hypothetical protein ACR2FJ_03780 [Qipengyuania sp.]
MTDPITQMAAMSAAMRMLLACDQRTKPNDLFIAASNELTGQLIAMMMSHAAERRSTFLALFRIEDNTALLERIMIVDGSTKKGEINVGGGKFVQKADGSFAILSINRDEPYEYGFSQGGRRLVRRAVKDDRNRAVMELRGLQALIAKADTASCRAEARTASISHC